MSWFHRHKWKPAAVTHMLVSTKGYWVSGFWHRIVDPPQRHCTEVLFRCECAAIKTQSVDGLWTLEEMSGPVSDKQFVKEAGVKL